MSETQRTLIRADAAAYIEAVYGPGGEGWFREVQSGPWQPGSHVRPKTTVSDAGQRRADYADTETEKSFALGLELTLDLKDNWRENYDEWCDRVQRMIIDMQNRLFGYGMLRMEYEDDSPFEVVFGSGSTEQVWLVSFTATYAAAVKEIG